MKWFIKLNLWEIYNLIRIKKEDELKIVFEIRYGIYKYQIIFFDLTNILIIYQILIN